MPCAPRPAAPASATTHAVIKAFFIAISGGAPTPTQLPEDYPRTTKRTIWSGSSSLPGAFFANDMQMSLAARSLKG
jgi:hypothetical protein